MECWWNDSVLKAGKTEVFRERRKKKLAPVPFLTFCKEGKLWLLHLKMNTAVLSGTFIPKYTTSNARRPYGIYSTNCKSIIIIIIISHVSTSIRSSSGRYKPVSTRTISPNQAL
jgi:hypothetical protein